MNQRMRIIVGVGVLALIILMVIGFENVRRRAAVLPQTVQNPDVPVITLVPGSIPVYLEGGLVAGFSPEDLGQLKKVSFVEPAEGVMQEGWMLRDVLVLYLPPGKLQADTQVTVSSSSRDKSAQLNWAEIETEENMIMFDLANRGTLKLVSKLERLDTREEWVQDVDKIDVVQPGAESP